MKKFLKISMVALLFCGAIFGLFYSLSSNGLLPFSQEEPRCSAVQIPEPTSRNLNIEELYSHLGSTKEYALAAEKAALAEFDARNCRTDSGYEDARKAVRLYFCFIVGGDFYGEGILQEADFFANAAWKKGCRDPLILTICDVTTYQESYSIKLGGARNQAADLALLLKSNYPPVCKFEAAATTVRNITHFLENRERWKEDMTPIAETLQARLDEMLEQFSAIVALGCPDTLTRRKAGRILWSANQRAEIMSKIGDSLDRILTVAKVPENVRAQCRGSFLIDWAWTARGSGWASSVTPEGWRLMADRLKAAQNVLEKSAEKFPDDPELPTEMITLELGQGMGKYRMNRLFEKAVALDPENFAAYSKKMYYIQPRWYGSSTEVVKFGLECIASDRWDAKIPLVFIEGIELIADQDASIYQHEELWRTVSKVFEEYLSRYPNSVHYRTSYLQWAAKGKHWDIVKVQQKILGGNWDRSVLCNSEYREIIASIPS